MKPSNKAFFFYDLLSTASRFKETKIPTKSDNPINPNEAHSGTSI